MRPHLEIGKRERARVVAVRKQGGNPHVQQPTDLTCHILRWCKYTRIALKNTSLSWKLRLTFLGDPSPSGVLLLSPSVMPVCSKQRHFNLFYLLTIVYCSILPSYVGSLWWRRTHRVPSPPCSSSTQRTDSSLSKLICHIPWPGDQGRGWMRLLPQATRHSEHLHGWVELIFSSYQFSKYGTICMVDEYLPLEVTSDKKWEGYEQEGGWNTLLEEKEGGHH